MDPPRHRRRPSSDRFFTLSPPSAATTTTLTTSSSSDFTEDDVVFTPSLSSPSPSPSPAPPKLRLQRSFKSEPSGILAALPDPTTTTASSIFNHKPLLSPAPPPPIQILPKKSSSFSHRHVSYAHSAPINVPPIQMAKKGGSQRRSKGSAFGFEDDDVGDGDGDGGDDDGEMLPPHEMVARRMASSPVVSCSVLEGAGRTLKGRDLRRVRNAVFRQTGLLDLDFFELITLVALALALSKIELAVCSVVKGSVLCTDCGPNYDFSGVQVLIKCDKLKDLSVAFTNEKGAFETKLPPNAPTSQASASPNCMAKLVGGSRQLL